MSDDNKGFDWGKLMMAVIIVIIAYMLFAISSAFGATVVTWEAPTQNTDNSPIPATGPGSLDGFKIYYNAQGATSGFMLDITDPAARTYSIPGLASGVWQFAMTAYNVEGVESARTPTVTTTVVGTSPLPPNPSFVTVETGVYNLVKKNNGFVMVFVGTVPLNTPCDPNQYVNGYNVVPFTSVNSWSGTTRPIVVLAKCSLR
jgi:hypothetical protein